MKKNVSVYLYLEYVKKFQTRLVVLVVCSTTSEFAFVQKLI